jgi:hypothetical protein
VQYETDENGMVPGKMWEDRSGDYSPSITTKVYQLNVPALADNLISDLIKRCRYENSGEDYVQTKYLDFVHEEEEKKEVFASKGKSVIYVRYYGYANINSIIENIENKIELIMK